MFKYTICIFPPVMNKLYLRNNEINNYDTINYNTFSVDVGRETLVSKINVNKILFSINYDYDLFFLWDHWKKVSSNI